jgi:hypothetical protein
MTPYVPLHVPEPYYRDVLAHLVSLMSEPREAPRSRAPALIEADASSDDAWQSAWPDLRDDSRQLMVVLAEHPGEWVPIAAFLDALGSPGAVQGALSSLRKRLKRVGSGFPFKIEDVDPETGRSRYRMDTATATIVRQLAEDA